MPGMDGSGRTRETQHSGQNSQELSREQEGSWKGKDLDSEMAMVQEFLYNNHYYPSVYRRNVVCCFFCA